MSSLRSVPKSEWRSFFDRMSRALVGKWAEIEVAAMDLGDTVVADWIPILGTASNSRDDLLDVALDRMNHLIRHPKDIVVEEDATGINSVAVLDSEGARQIVHLRVPLLLPPAAAHS